MPTGGDAWVDLEPDFCVGGELESFQEGPVEAGEVRCRVVGRGPASPVILSEQAAVAQVARYEVGLGDDPIEVRVGDALPPGHNDVASAERAAGLAEGQVDVEREGIGRPLRRCVQSCGVVFGAECVGELDRGGVGRVAGAGLVVALQQLRGELDHADHPFTVSTMTATFSTGLERWMPWPKLKMWPGDPWVSRRIASTAEATTLGSVNNTAGSRLP